MRATPCIDLFCSDRTKVAVLEEELDNRCDQIRIEGENRAASLQKSLKQAKVEALYHERNDQRNKEATDEARKAVEEVRLRIHACPASSLRRRSRLPYFDGGGGGFPAHSIEWCAGVAAVGTRADEV